MNPRLFVHYQNMARDGKVPGFRCTNDNLLLNVKYKDDVVTLVCPVHDTAVTPGQYSYELTISAIKAFDPDWHIDEEN